jgi:hypothetical protein
MAYLFFSGSDFQIIQKVMKSFTFPVFLNFSVDFFLHLLSKTQMGTPPNKFYNFHVFKKKIQRFLHLVTIVVPS